MILRGHPCVGDNPQIADTEVQKCGEQKGLETLVVHTVTYEY